MVESFGMHHEYPTGEIRCWNTKFFYCSSKCWNSPCANYAENLFLVKAVYCMTWLKRKQRLLTAFHEICDTTVNSAEVLDVLSLNSQCLLSAREQVIWLMIIFISLKGSFPTIGVKSLSRFLRAGFLNSILASHPVAGGGSLPPSISSGRYSSLFPHISCLGFFSLFSAPSLHTSQGNKIWYWSDREIRCPFQ